MRKTSTCARRRAARETGHRYGDWSLGLATTVLADRRGSFMMVGTAVLLLFVCPRRASAEEPRATLKGHTSGITSVAVSPDGRLLASASGLRNSHIQLWDLVAQKEITTFEGAFAVFSPNGKMLTAIRSAPGKLNANEVQVWEIATRRERVSLLATGLGRSLAFSPDSRLLAVGAVNEDTNAYVWDLVSGEQRAVLRGHKTYVMATAFSPDGKVLATGSKDGAIKLWDIESAKEVAELKDTPRPRESLLPVRALVFAPDGETLVTSNEMLPVGLWDVAKKKRWARLENQIIRANGVGSGADAVSLSFSADGKRLVLGKNTNGFEVYDMDTVERIASVRHDGGRPTVAAISPDGKTVVTGSADGLIRVWDVPASKK